MGSATSQHAGTILLPHLNGELHWAHYGIQGKRDAMEDAYVVDSLGNEALFGVFDGHYGKRAALVAAEQLPRVLKEQLSKKMESTPEMLRTGFLAMDKLILDKSRAENWHDGTTALVALLSMSDQPNLKKVSSVSPLPSERGSKPAKGRGKLARRASDSSLGSSVDEDNVDEPVLTDDGSQRLSVYIANAGDCRAISVYGDGRVFQLSTDHTPLLPYERWRVFKAGGNVKFGRIEGKLSVSRGFGDRQFKEPKALVSANPEVVSFDVTQNLRFVILACDGVWGWLDNIQVAKFVSKSLKEGNRPETVVKDLVKYAFDQGSTDNISVILLYFTLGGTQSTPVPNTPVQDPTKPALKTSKKHAGAADEAKKSAAPTEPNAPQPVSATPPSASAITTPTKAKTPVANAKDDISKTPVDRVTQRSNVALTSSAKAKKFNFMGAAGAMKWPTDLELNRLRGVRSTLITTHIPTGDTSYLDQSDFDSTTSEIEALALDARHPMGSQRDFSKPASTRVVRDIGTSSSSNLDQSSEASTPAHSSDSEEVQASLKRPIRAKSDFVASSPPSKFTTAPQLIKGGPASRRARVALPDDDEDVAFTPNSMPNTPAKVAPSRSKGHQKAKSDLQGIAPVLSAKQDRNYGLSDSEGSEEIEAEMRRRSFDSARPSGPSTTHNKSLPTTSAQSGTTTARSKAARSGSSNSNNDMVSDPVAASGFSSKRKKTSYVPDDMEIPASAPSTGQTKATQPSPARSKKKSLVQLDELSQDSEDIDAHVHRRAASFDLPRPEKTRKKKVK